MVLEFLLNGDIGASLNLVFGGNTLGLGFYCHLEDLEAVARGTALIL